MTGVGLGRDRAERIGPESLVPRGAAKGYTDGGFQVQFTCPGTRTKEGSISRMALGKGWYLPVGCQASQSAKKVTLGGRCLHSTLTAYLSP
jgi:hypothetical protein